jgi:hypothetical protein
MTHLNRAVCAKLHNPCARAGASNFSDNQSPLRATISMHVQHIAAKYQFSRLIRNVLINDHRVQPLGTNNQVPIGIT